MFFLARAHVECHVGHNSCIRFQWYAEFSSGQHQSRRFEQFIYGSCRISCTRDVFYPPARPALLACQSVPYFKKCFTTDTHARIEIGTAFKRESSPFFFGSGKNNGVINFDPESPSNLTKYFSTGFSNISINSRRFCVSCFAVSLRKKNRLH